MNTIGTKIDTCLHGSDTLVVLGQISLHAHQCLTRMSHTSLKLLQRRVHFYQGFDGLISDRVMAVKIFLFGGFQDAMKQSFSFFVLALHHHHDTCVLDYHFTKAIKATHIYVGFAWWKHKFLRLQQGMLTLKLFQESTLQRRLAPTKWTPSFGIGCWYYIETIHHVVLSYFPGDVCQTKQNNPSCCI